VARVQGQQWKLPSSCGKLTLTSPSWGLSCNPSLSSVPLRRGCAPSVTLLTRNCKRLKAGRFFKLIRRVDNDLQPNRNLPIEFAPSNGANDVRFFRREGHLFVGRPFDIVFILEGSNAAASSHQRGHLPVGADGLKGLLGMVARFGFLSSCTPDGQSVA